MHSLIKPKYFIPVHGEFRHMHRHRMLAKDLGMQDRNIIIPELGMCVEVNRNFLRATGTVVAGERLVDGTGLGDLESVVLRDRKLLSEEGLCVVLLTISSRSGEIIGEPNIISRGFIYQDEASELIKDAKEALLGALSTVDIKSLDLNELKMTVKKIASTYFFKKTKRKPMILTIVNEQ